MKIKLMVKIIIEAFYVRTLYLFRFLVLNRVEYSSTFIPGTKLISSDLKLGQRRCYSSEAILTGFPQNCILPKNIAGNEKAIKKLSPWWITGYTDGEGLFYDQHS